MSRRPPARSITTIALLLVLAACDPDVADAPGVSADSPVTILRRGNGGDPRSLDPARAEDTHSFRVLTDLYEGLVSVDATGAIVSGVAASWRISDDGLVYTFKLRPDATWSNGERVTSQDFVAGFRRTLGPEFGSAYSFLLHPLRNAARVQNDELPVAALGVSAPDDETLVLELDAPAAHLLAVLAMPIAFPLAPKAGSFSEPARFVGNGPYRLQDWQRGHRIRLEKNPLFREADTVAYDVVEYYAIDDLVSEYNMYRAGELDITASVPGNYVAELKESRPTEFRTAPKLGLYYLAFDLSEAPLNDPELRKALSMALDRNALVEILGRGEQSAYGIVPSGIPGYDASRYDWQILPDAEREDAARHALAASDIELPFEITLTYDTGDVHETIALAVSSMWRDVLGIATRLDKREWQYFLETRARRGEWQAMRFAWIGDYNHPNTFAELFHSQSVQNLPGYRSQAYDDRLASARAATDPDLAAELFAAAEMTLLADYPVAPLYFYVSKHLVSPSVRGFEDNALDRHPSRYLGPAEPGTH